MFNGHTLESLVMRNKYSRELWAIRDIYTLHAKTKSHPLDCEI